MMVQTSNIFASTRVKSRENKLLGSERLLRMLDAASPADAVKVLYEISFADGMTLASASEYQKLLDAELKGVLMFFSGVCTDAKVFRCFTARFDFHNAKALIKAKYLKLQDWAFMLYEGASLPVETLKEAIFADNYTFLPKAMAKALSDIDLAYSAAGKNPRLFDVRLDKAMYEYIFEELGKGAPSDIKKYFIMGADISNILTALKCKQQQLSAKEYEEMFIAGGAVTLKTCLSMYESQLDTWHEYLKFTPYRDIVKNAAEDGITGAEVAAAALTDMLYRDKKHNVSSIYPLLNYFLTKLAEISNIKLVLTGLSGGADKAEIKKRLRAL